jgi:hypothetical protein
MRYHRRGAGPGRILHGHDRQVACRFRAWGNSVGTRFPSQPEHACRRSALFESDGIQRRNEDVPERPGSLAQRSPLQSAVVRQRPVDRAGDPLHRRSNRRRQAVLLVSRARRAALPLHGAGSNDRQVSRPIHGGLGPIARAALCAPNRIGTDRRKLEAGTAAGGDPCLGFAFVRRAETLRRHDGDLRRDDRPDRQKRRQAGRTRCASAGNWTTR